MKSISRPIKSLIQSNTLAENIFLLASLFLFFGLWGVRAFITVAPILMVLSAILNYKNVKDFSLGKILYDFWPVLFFYFVLVFSFLWTEDVIRWQDLLIRKLPLLIFPLTFSCFKFKKKNVLFILGAFSLGVFVIAILTYIHYLGNKAYLDAMILHSKNIPVFFKIFHIHFGIMMAFAIFFSFYVYQELETASRWIFFFMSMSIFIFLHLLGYRTGLLGFYFLMTFFMIRLVIREKRYIFAASVTVFFLITFTMFYFSNETVRLKFENTIGDVKQFYSGGDINFYSISMRLAAWTNAIDIFKQEPLIGVGMADMELAMDRQYDVQGFGLYPDNRVLIHNQYLHTLVTTGILGFLVFLFLLYRPIQRNNYLKNGIGLQFIILCIGTMLADSYLELQAGLNLFLFFYCLMLVDWAD